jgi:hypothetical protein
MHRRLCFPAFRKKAWINEESHRLSIAEVVLAQVLPQNGERKIAQTRVSGILRLRNPLSSPTIPGGPSPGLPALAVDIQDHGVRRPTAAANPGLMANLPWSKQLSTGVTLPGSGGEGLALP